MLVSVRGVDSSVYKVSMIPLSRSPVPLACLKGGSIDIAGCSVIIYINQLVGIREDAVILVGRRRASASSNATASTLAADESLGTLRIIVAISFAQIQGRRSRTSGLNGISWYRRAVVIVDIFYLRNGLCRRTLGGGVGDWIALIGVAGDDTGHAFGACVNGVAISVAVARLREAGTFVGALVF